MTATRKLVVLVVEDEPLLRITAVDLVEDAGFEALSASNADEAVRILEARSDIRLVFTDVEMGSGMNGLKLAACIRDRWPPVEIIITSGKVTVDDLELPARSVFFPKPYRTDAVAAAMHGFLG
jgi:CheY-like chemotaxis protein